MIDSEIRRFIIQEIEKRLNVLASGSVDSNTNITESINELFPGMPKYEDRPVSHPYGYVSRAPVGTICVTGRQGSHPGNYLVLGHRDKDRPQLENGESALYSLGKYQIFAKNNKLFLGKNGTLEEMVMGQTLKEFLLALLDHIIAHRHIGNLGILTSTPDNITDFNNDKNNYIANDKILAKDGGRF